PWGKVKPETPEIGEHVDLIPMKSPASRTCPTARTGCRAPPPFGTHSHAAERCTEPNPAEQRGDNPIHHCCLMRKGSHISDTASICAPNKAIYEPKPAGQRPTGHSGTSSR